jgi:hypothetical protein
MFNARKTASHVQARRGSPEEYMGQQRDTNMMLASSGGAKKVLSTESIRSCEEEEGYCELSFGYR